MGGNKRIAFAAAHVFLRINGYRIAGRPQVIYRRMMKLFENRAFELKSLDSLLRKHVVAES